jgi:glycosyltransferase involved in cell wall biosynthesis
MKILNVNVGPPVDDYSAWIRKIKMANIIRSLGHEMDFVIYAGKDEPNKEILADISFPYEIIKVNPLNIHFKHLNRLKKEDYDIVFCNGQLTHAILFLTKLTSVKLILDRHGDMLEEFLLLEGGFKFNPSFLGRYLFLKLINFLNLTFSDKILCVSYKMMENLLKQGIKPKKAAYVTNGIDLSLFKIPNSEILQEMKKELGISNKMIFTYVGACEKWQGVNDFIKAAKNLKDDDHLIFLIVGGDKKSKENNIIYLPKVPQNEVINYYALSDVLVLPRPSHPTTEVAAPTKFPEYLAMEKPILTTNVGDASYLVKKHQCGLVVKDSNPESLVEGILEFKKKTPPELNMMGSNSKKLAEEEFSMKKMTKDLSKALEDW